MFTLCLFLIILYLGVVFAASIPYWYETGNTPCADIPASSWRVGPVIRLWLEASWFAFLLIIAVLLDPILRRIKAKNAEADKDDLPPVLLVHGLYHNPSGWIYFRRHLQKAGFRKIHTVSYSSWKTDLAAVTGKLDAAVAKLESQYPGKKPLLVGHSLGGLILRNWLSSEENQNRALGAITLGAPHQGSRMATLAFGQLGKSLHPSNPFFEELARTEKAASIPCVALVSEADTMVLPQANLIPVTKGWEMRLTPYATHAGILTKGSSLRMAIWELHRILNTVKQEAPAPEGQTEQ